MDAEFKFVLLDFGHPMSNNTIKSVMKSLEDTLVLGLGFPLYTKEIHFGISFLNSDFTILHSESYIRKNYDLINQTISVLLKAMKNTNKVTVPEYKQFLCKSIARILRISEEKFETENFCSQSKSLQIKVAIVTKKTASILVDILTDVASKLENISSTTVKQNYKIVQILNEQDEKTYGTSNESPFIKWTTCSDNSNDLRYFLKDWFLNRPEKLQILLSKDLNFTLQCDIDNIIADPISVPSVGKYDLFNDVRSTTSFRNPSLGTLKPMYDLEILNRIPVSSLCPTLVFGIPRRIRATRNELNWVQSQTNLQMFEELCRELYRTEQGLLTKSVLKSVNSELTTFHFLTSDGYMLLMNDVTPEELYLPNPERSSKPELDGDESAATLIKSCIQKIKFLDEYIPENYSSGLYQYLRNYLMQAGQSKSLLGSFDPNVKLFGRKSREKRVSKDNSKDESRPKKRQKQKNYGKKLQNREKKIQNVHPALLSPEVVEKYRKVSLDAFNLPELGEDYNDIRM